MQNNIHEKITPSIIEKGKTIGAVSYLTFIGLVIALVINHNKKNEFVSFHIRQSVGICLTAIVLLLLGIIPVLGWFISIVGFIVLLIIWVTGFINAINGEIKPLPVLGKQYDRWFKNI